MIWLTISVELNILSYRYLYYKIIFGHKLLSYHKRVQAIDNSLKTNHLADFTPISSTSSTGLCINRVVRWTELLMISQYYLVTTVTLRNRRCWSWLTRPYSIVIGSLLGNAVKTLVLNLTGVLEVVMGHTKSYSIISSTSPEINK